MTLVEPIEADAERAQKIDIFRKSNQYARQADTPRDFEFHEKRKNAFYEKGKNQVWYHRLR